MCCKPPAWSKAIAPSSHRIMPATASSARRPCAGTCWSGTRNGWSNSRRRRYFAPPGTIRRPSRSSSASPASRGPYSMSASGPIRGRPRSTCSSATSSRGDRPRSGGSDLGTTARCTGRTSRRLVMRSRQSGVPPRPPPCAWRSPRSPRAATRPWS